MNKKNKRKNIIIALVALISLACLYRYHQINRNVAETYENPHYS
jgi:lipopolysaccharide export system protein LptC